MLKSSVQGTQGAQGVWKSLADQRFHCIWVQFTWISSRKASQYPDFGGLKEMAPATPGPWGHTAIHMLQSPSAFHTPALGPLPLRLQGMCHCSRQSGLRERNSVIFFLVCPIIRTGLDTLVTSLGGWIFFGGFYFFFLMSG